MFLEQRYPALVGHIEGGTYPPPQHAVIAMQLAGMLQMATLALLFFGNQIFAMIGIPEPDLLKQMQDNKMMTFMTVFMLNSLATSMSSTGAFEIEFNGQIIYSKLQEGRMPSASVLISRFDKLGLDTR